MKTQEALAWISEVFEHPPGRITAATMREEIPGWDSLGTLALIAAFDERLNIQLNKTDIEEMKAVGDILEILRRNASLEDA